MNTARTKLIRLQEKLIEREKSDQRMINHSFKTGSEADQGYYYGSACTARYCIEKLEQIISYMEAEGL